MKQDRGSRTSTMVGPWTREELMLRFTVARASSHPSIYGADAVDSAQKTLWAFEAWREREASNHGAAYRLVLDHLGDLGVVAVDGTTPHLTGCAAAKCTLLCRRPARTRSTLKEWCAPAERRALAGTLSLRGKVATLRDVYLFDYERRGPDEVFCLVAEAGEPCAKPPKLRARRPK